MAIRADFLWTVGSRATYALSQWLILALVARFAPSHELGEFTFALAVVAPITVFAHLNMRGYMATDATAEFGFFEYLGAQFFTIGVAMLAIAGVAAWTTNGGGLTVLLLLIGAYKSVECVSAIHYGAMQRSDRMREMGISVMAHGISALAVMAAALRLSGSVTDGNAGILVAWLAILFVYDARIAHVSHEVMPRGLLYLARVSKVVASCLPMGIVLVMLTLRSYIPVYFIKAELGTEQVGIYSVVSYFMVAGSLLIGSLLQVAAPRLANYHRDQRREEAQRLMIKMLGIVCAVGAAGILGAWLLGNQVLNLAYGERFETQRNLLVWVMVASAIIYASQPLGQLLTVMRRFRYEVLSNGVGIFVIAVSSSWLVPLNGLIGAAQALSAGALTSFFAHVIAVYQIRPALLFEAAEDGQCNRGAKS